MKKNLLWPTEIYSFKNNTINNTEILNLILQKEETEESRSISNIGGWQSSEDLLFESSFHEVKTFLFQCTDMLKKELYEDDAKFSLLQSWANVNRNGDYNMGHIHGNSHWSCVYYVTETYTSPLYFVDPRIRMGMDSSHYLLKNKYFNTLGSKKNMPGDVIFFPSWLEHGVSKNSTNNPRISIACNFSLGK